MEPPNASNSNVVTPLFPAYSSSIQHETDNKDWLRNSSFTESAFQQVSHILHEQKKKVKPEEVFCVPVEPEVATYKPNDKQKKSQKRKYEKFNNFTAIPESESILNQLKKKTFIEETGLSFERAFCIDPTRDAENLMFENFERTKTANYYIRVEFPIGLSSEEFSLWSQNLPKKKCKVPERYFSKSFLKSLKNITLEKVFPNKEPLNFECFEYVPISVDQNINFQNNQDETFPIFCNVSSSWKVENIKKNVLDESLDEIDVNRTKEKVIFYNKKLSENPYDINTWLEFVHFQDKIALNNDQFHKKDDRITQNIIHEKKIAILEKALKHNPKELKLNIMKLKLCQGSYSTDKLNSMWETLIVNNARNPEAWQNYLLYIISNLETFNVSGILNLYTRCLQILSSLDKATAVQKPPPDIVSTVLRIFNQLCIILKSCGYIEKGIALYQALMEFNLFCDQYMKKIPLKERVTCFEPFWDSGAPRIGEKNAIGWASTMQQKKVFFDYISTDSDLNNMEDDILCKQLSVSETWLEFEQLRELHHWIPWRPNPEYDQTSDDVDDPERIVSFNDVSKLLFSIDNESDLFMLALDFLSFLGFDAHLFGCHINSEKIFSYTSIDHYENILKEVIASKLINPQKNPLYLKTNEWSEERFLFVDNVFSQLCDKFIQKYKTHMTYIWLKFRKFYVFEVKKESKEDIKILKRFVKEILKMPENRNCLLHWLEYIHIEWMIDPQTSLRTVHTLLLSSTLAYSSGSVQLEELLYFLQYILDLTVVSNHSNTFISSKEILWILFHVANKENYTPYSNQEITPTMILKTVAAFKRQLDKEFDRLLNVKNTLCYCIDPYFYSIINCSKCFAYFQYYCNSIDASLEVYNSAISFIDSNMSSFWGQYLKEELCIAQAELLNYHTWNSNASIKPLQKILNEFIEKYPYNSKFLWMLVKMKNAASVISPTRRFLTQILNNSDKSQPVTWVFALTAEFAISHSLSKDFVQDEKSIDDYISTLGINWRIRSLYEKMLKCDLCAHIPLLWRSYLKFEMLIQNMERAKSIFHRALQNCGWSKELLMDGITYFPDQFKDILGLMNEKQIRIHTPLEEVLLLLEHGVETT